jgi:hypothetical protein
MGTPGVEFQLSFRMLDARMGCKPMSNAELYLWHCDADGLSGFSGQDPSKPYMGSSSPAPSTIERFCRGIQLIQRVGDRDVHHDLSRRLVRGHDHPYPSDWRG